MEERVTAVVRAARMVACWLMAVWVTSCGIGTSSTERCIASSLDKDVDTDFTFYNHMGSGLSPSTWELIRYCTDACLT